MLRWGHGQGGPVTESQGFEGTAERRGNHGRKWGSERREIGRCYASALRMEDGATSQGVQAASTSWKRPGNMLPQSLQEECRPQVEESEFV